ncbi:MAG: endopeptidase La [Desulfarculus sp.]|nr:endopeptidase La [Pseudomonadota bacterium]MBV1716555.1 endopeptidase La [Desulfarculus sp.]MBU4575842.1 endopeptidase La [Pseudomonadota bacterium]MBU4597683.1 endopeptidase La [Pseudomonadota bacterium]MBV1736791.1 endopeptidase La [Desulfarculus sp.]
MRAPLMPLRDVVIFPSMVAPLFVGRDRSVAALEYAMEHGKTIFLATQREAKVDDPREGDIYQVGTLSTVLQLLRLPDGTVKALIEGRERARVIGYQPNPDFFMVDLEVVDQGFATDLESEALIRSVVASFDQYAKLNKKIPKEVLLSVSAVTDPGTLADTVVGHLPLKLDDKQQLLELIEPNSRLSRLFELLRSEIEILQIEQRIKSRVKRQMEKTQREYYLNEQMRAIQKEMGEKDDLKSEVRDLEEKLKKKPMPREARMKIEAELKKLKMMSPMSAEATVVRNYVDWLMALPWRERTRDSLDLKAAHAILDDDHYGLDKPKERILEFLAVQALTKKIKGPILCFVGPPGVGKTSLARSIARAMGRNFIRVSLGGVRDEAEIRGHRRTYIGALPGKIIQSMRRAGSINPVFCLDEVDKMSTDFRGDPSAALLEVLDPEQNYAFNDHYLDVDYNLSEVMFITTANTLYSIPAPLQDRMEIIRLPGYTELEKLGIATQFLLPKQAKANGLAPEQVQLSDKAILEIARRYTREAGVRNLERELASVCRKVAKRLVSENDVKGTVRVSVSAVESYLGVPKFRYGLPEETDHVGLSNGLAWTETGGEVLTTEAIIMPGKGKLTITGKLGEVMQESAQAALSYVRSRGKSLGLPEDFYTKVDLHIHVPEGAIPKDGPSAGITLATALVSALTRIPVKATVAMTGEITLRGRVLPIGGLREKVLAAHRAQITQVLIPKDNEKDIKEIPQRVLKAIELIPVEHMDQVLTYALAVDDPGAIFRESPEPYVLPTDAKKDAANEVMAH